MLAFSTFHVVFRTSAAVFCFSYDILVVPAQYCILYESNNIDQHYRFDIVAVVDIVITFAYNYA